MAAINRQWHASHKLASGADLDRRIAWHIEHAAVCGCRPIPGRVLAAMAERGQPTPPRLAQTPAQTAPGRKAGA